MVYPNMPKPGIWCKFNLFQGHISLDELKRSLDLKKEADAIQFMTENVVNHLRLL